MHCILDQIARYALQLYSSTELRGMGCILQQIARYALKQYPEAMAVMWRAVKASCGHCRGQAGAQLLLKDVSYLEHLNVSDGISVCLLLKLGVR